MLQYYRCCMNICKYFYSVALPSYVGGVQDMWVEVVTQALAQKSGGKIPHLTSCVIGFHLLNNIMPFVKGMTSYLDISFNFLLCLTFTNSLARVQTPFQPLHVFLPAEWKWNIKDEQKKFRLKSFSHLYRHTHLLSCNYLHLPTLALKGLVTFGENRKTQRKTEGEPWSQTCKDK